MPSNDPSQSQVVKTLAEPVPKVNNAEWKKLIEKRLGHPVPK